MEVDPIKNTIIVYATESHACPSAAALIEENMRIFNGFEFPQIFCGESPHTLPLIELNKVRILQAEGNKKTLDVLQQFLLKIPGLSFPIVPKVLIEGGEQLAQIYPSARAGWRKLPHYINNLQKLELDKFIFELNIPFQGIENSDNANHQVYHLPVSESRPLLHSLENQRITAMTNNIFEKALPLLPEGQGIIWVSGGLAHVQNLAAAALKYIHDHDLNTDRSFTILPIVCYSAYATHAGLDEPDEVISSAKEHLKDTEYYSWFDKIKYHVADDAIEEAKFKFSSRKFTNLMKFVEKSYLNRHQFTIPDWDEEKDAIVKQHHGKILQREGSDAIISIASEKLLQPLRDSLGISRSIIKFDRLTDNQVATRKNLLENDSSITVEAQIDPKHFKVTFPKSKLEFVKAIVESPSI